MPIVNDLKRLHGLDALRASMMLLGLVLHSAASYTMRGLGQAWPYQDAYRSAMFDPLIFIIHLFRMPTFFVIAGFFAALLFYREGSSGFVWHRTQRILIPLTVAWLVLYPLMVFGVNLAEAGGGIANLGIALRGAMSEPYRLASLGHLWFLYYLFIFCVVAAAVVPLLQLVPERVRTSLVSTYGRIAPTMAGCLVLGVVSGLTLLPMTRPMLDTSISFVPAFRVLVAYAVFFTFGWLLFVRRDLVPSFGRYPWRYLVAGLAGSVAYLVVLLRPPVSDPTLAHVLAVLIGGVATALLVYGVTAVFVRYAANPSPLQRYIADASYWIYLIHLPVILILAGLMAPVALPAVVKFAIVLTVTTVVTTGTYHFFVRATVIGAFLNGRRFARGLPRTEPPPVIARVEAS